MKITLTALLLFLGTRALAATAGCVSNTPDSVQELTSRIQGKAPAEVREEIINRFGPHQKNIGSGIRIELWQLQAGRLVFNPLIGPTFFDSKTERTCWLMRTSNAAGVNLVQSYEMLTVADPSNHGNQFWLGDLDLRSDGTYLFTDSDQFPDQRAAQRRNFFMLNPSGTVRVLYTGSVTAETHLESLEEGVVVARLIFTSSKGDRTANYSVVSSEQHRRLEFRSDDPLSFAMATGWQSYWH